MHRTGNNEMILRYTLHWCEFTDEKTRMWKVALGQDGRNQ